MKNTTKFEATAEHISAAFTASGIGVVHDISELSDGWFNRIYSACDEKGKKYVIKFAPIASAPVMTYEQNMMESEVRCYKLLQEKTAVKTPKLIYSDFSKSIVPTEYFIMDFLKGVRLDKVKLSAEDELKVMEKKAQIYAEFHKIEGVGYGYEQNGLNRSWKAALKQMIENLIKDTASYGKRCKIGQRLLEYVDKLSYALDDVPCALVNYDMHNMNIFFNKDDNGEIELSILDVERFFWGDPIGDFVIENRWRDSLGKKQILKYYNMYAKKDIHAGKNEEIRLSLLCGYLAVLMYSERFSRFRLVWKIFNPAYVSGTLGYKIFKKIAFNALKKY